MELLDMARTCGACGLKTETPRTRQSCWSLNAFVSHVAKTVATPTVTTFGDGWHIALAAMHGVDVDVVSLNTLMSILSSIPSASFADKDANASWSLALHLLPKLRTQALQPDLFSFSSCINVMSAQLKWGIAVELMDTMADMDTILLNSALGSLARAGEWQIACNTLLSVLSMSSLPSNLSHFLKSTVPDVVSFNTCLNACENARVSLPALHLLGCMHRNKVDPNQITMNTAISACDKTSQWESALSLLGDSQQYHLLPDTITYNASISACGYQWRQASSIFLSMNSHLASPDEFTFAAVISACASASQLNLALAHLTDMLNHNNGGHLKPNLVVYNATLSGCERGDWKMALELLRIISQSLQPDLFGYTSAIRSCQKASKWQQICALLEDMQKGRVQEDSFCIDAAVGSMERAQKVAHAVRLLSKIHIDLSEPI